MTKLRIRPIEGDKMLKGMHEAACPKCGWRIQAYSTPGEAFDLAPENCPSCNGVNPSPQPEQTLRSARGVRPNDGASAKGAECRGCELADHDRFGPCANEGGATDE